MADALLSPAVGGGLYAASAAAIAFSAKKVTRDDVGRSKAPLMAVSGAMVFAAQMINFTIPGTGSSGHIGGGVLLAALLGPFAGLLALAAVLVIQCLCFADGGLLALGCNIFNIAVIPCLFIYPLVFRPILSRAKTVKRIWLASVISAVLALQLGAFGVVTETAASGVIELPFAAFALLMQPIHLAIGVVEGLVTAAILNFVHAARPETLMHPAGIEKSAPSAAIAQSGAAPGVDASEPASRLRPPKKSMWPVIIVFACIAAALAAGFSALASAYPDGLEWSVGNVAGKDFLGESGDEAYTPVSGLIGAALVFVLAGLVALLINLYKKRKKGGEAP